MGLPASKCALLPPISGELAVPTSGLRRWEAPEKGYQHQGRVAKYGKMMY